VSFQCAYHHNKKSLSINTIFYDFSIIFYGFNKKSVNALSIGIKKQVFKGNKKKEFTYQDVVMLEVELKVQVTCQERDKLMAQNIG
jgi:hypothetical protein